MTSAADRLGTDDETASGLATPSNQLTYRQRYLRYCGFQYDAFAQPNAEQEYGFSDTPTLHIPTASDEKALSPHPDDIPPVFPRAYYVDPRYADRRIGSVFDDLRAPGHALVYGEPGAGKTTLRLAVETYARAFPDKTLVVTYEPGRAVENEIVGAMADESAATPDAPNTAATDVHLRLLAAALAVDLFIQIIEQFGLRREPPTERQNDALCYLITTVEPRLKAVLQRLMRGEEPADLWGFAWLWRRLDRPIVRPIVRTPQMHQWFDALRHRRREPDEEPLSGAALWQRSIETAQLWGFERVFIMLDGLDTYWRRPPDMLRLLDPLLRLLPEFAAQQVSLKAFLPVELENLVSGRLQAHGVPVDEVRVVVLAWTDERLRALVLARYRAARSRRHSLSDLVEEEAREEGDDRLTEPAGNNTSLIAVERRRWPLDDLLIKAARGNPRRLLSILNALIDVHIGDPDRPVERPIARAEFDTAVALAEARMAV